MQIYLKLFEESWKDLVSYLVSIGMWPWLGVDVANPLGGIIFFSPLYIFLAVRGFDYLFSHFNIMVILIIIVVVCICLLLQRRGVVDYKGAVRRLTVLWIVGSDGGSIMQCLNVPWRLQFSSKKCRKFKWGNIYICACKLWLWNDEVVILWIML